MPILPIQALGALAAAVPLAETAVSGVTSAFADLLKAATSAEPEEHGNSSPLSASGLTELGGAAASDSPTSQLRNQTETLLRRFHQLITQLIDVGETGADGGLHIQSDGTGQIQVEGGQIAASRVQELISARPDLRQLFDQIVANVNLLRMAEGPTSASQQSDVSLIVDANQTKVAND